MICIVFEGLEETIYIYIHVFFTNKIIFLWTKKKAEIFLIFALNFISLFSVNENFSSLSFHVY